METWGSCSTCRHRTTCRERDRKYPCRDYKRRVRRDKKPEGKDNPERD